METELKKENILICSVGISLLTAVGLLVCLLSFNMLPLPRSMIFSVSLPTIFALFFIPKFFQKRFHLETDTQFFKTKLSYITIPLMLCFSIGYVLLFHNNFESYMGAAVIIIHYLAVTIGEEFVYRNLLPGLLSKKFNKVSAVIISSLLFALILHINEPILANLAIRLPLGLIFGTIAAKTKSISYTIMLHTMYNLTVFLL